MKFFINNVKLLFNCKIILIIAICFIVNVFYSGENFSTVIYGVEGGFNLNTAIPWLALVFPFFLVTGAFFSQRDDNKIFVISRMKNLRSYYFGIIVVLIFFASIYCTFCGAVSFVAGGVFKKTILSVVLLFFNFLFLATVQWSAYSLTGNTMVSIIIPLMIVVCALVFYKNNFNIGTWAMIVRSSLNRSDGFNVIIAIIFQLFFTILFCIVSIFLNKIFKERL